MHKIFIHCRNCTWWKVGDITINRRQPPGFGSCECQAFQGMYSINPVLPLDNILLECDEGWECFTGPDFGCVHGEARNIEQERGKK